MKSAGRHNILAISSVALLVVAVASLAAVPSAAAKALSLQITKSSTNITVPPVSSGTIGSFFSTSQYLTGSCRSGARSLAPGIISANRPIASQSHGPSVVSGFGVGEAGKASFQLQTLCATGGTSTSVRTIRTPGRHVPGLGRRIGGMSTGRTTAVAACPRKYIALGAPLSSEFGPVFGSLESKPEGRNWRVVMNDVPDILLGNRVVPAYADAACLHTKHVKNVNTEKATTTGLHAGNAASVSVPCKSGRRPLGWGVHLQPYSRSSFTNGGRWLIPTVAKAQFNRSSIAFSFTLPEGALPAGQNGLSVADATQTAYVVCGQLTGK